MSLTCVLVSGRDDIIFKSHGRYARWDDVLSLVLGSHVHIAIIDAWACLLNCREARKDFAALTRFFASAFFMVRLFSMRQLCFCYLTVFGFFMVWYFNLIQSWIPHALVIRGFFGFVRGLS